MARGRCFAENLGWHRRLATVAAIVGASPTTPTRPKAPSAKVFASTEHTFWRSPDGRATLLAGDCLEQLQQLPAESVDVVFADPPYFLSNGGTTCKAGRRVSVDKGKWDRSLGVDDNHAFNRSWLEACQRVLQPNGTIWVSGTSHVIYSVGFAMQQLGFKLLNEIVWEKPNPPPNLSCRYFTHSTETVLWAARDRKSRHFFDYASMRRDNGGKQMKSVWRMTAPGKSEKLHGSHPTQKPIDLLARIVAASCPPGGVVLDPFNGSGTTGVAALRGHARYIGIEREPQYLELSRRRLAAELGERPRLVLAAE
ncbi:MAG: site-specific DNA-methyltransferase [Nannocystaceae bacterium]|nr:site-specific DNA-methyltransferase [Nannocystaceae bacterium]